MNIFNLLECSSFGHQMNHSIRFVGNLYDAVSLAVKAALHGTRIPKVKGKYIDGANVDLELSDDLFECWKLDVSEIPCLVTLCKVSLY